MTFRALLGTVAAAVLAAAPAFAQRTGAPPASAPPSEQAQIAQGLSLLGQGDTTRAAALATRLLAQYPRNPAVLSFAVDVELARAGALSGLDTYERWLGSRKLEDAYVLRRIARASLREASRFQRPGGARIEALKALAADDDADARTELERAASAGNPSETVALAGIGNDRAVTILIGELNSTPGNKTRQIAALGDSHNSLAVRPLVALLSDPLDFNRAAAAEALGKLGATGAINQIKSLLNDPVPYPVQYKAAAALYRLNDMSGLTFLRNLEGSPQAGMRLSAAQAMATTPDAAWQALVRGLTQDSEATVSMEAARLIAPYDPDLARATLERLMGDVNVGVRQMAANVYTEVARDFAALRRFLRGTDDLARVRAAGRILELTR